MSVLKILVTGGAGFIGSHVVDAYVAAGHEVVVVDDLSSGSKYVHPEATFYKVNIKDRQTLTAVFEKEKTKKMFDVVNHHAAQIDVNRSILNRAADAETNIMGTINLLEMCSIYGVKKFIFASTAAIYGTHEPPIGGGLTEVLEPMPLSPYGISKRAAEDYVKNALVLFDIHSIILRYPNVYGPRQTSGDGGVISIFTRKMLKNEDVTIFGGNQTRDFLFVDDAAEANVYALGCKADHAIINIGTGKSTSIRELFGTLKDLTAYNKMPLFVTERKGEVRHSRFDVSKAKELINWSFHVDLNEGLKKTIEYFNHAA